MSGYRQFHTHIWSDSWFAELKPDMKLLFIYLFSNERAAICGFYELPVRTISFETGLDREVAKKGLEVLRYRNRRWRLVAASVSKATCFVSAFISGSC
jgi:hypothetical protein